MSTTATPTALDRAVADLLDSSSQTVKLASVEINVHRKAAAAAAAKAGPLLQKLASIGVIRQDQAKIAETMLAEHATTLDLVEQLAPQLMAKIAELETALATAKIGGKTATAGVNGRGTADPSAPSVPANGKTGGYRGLIDHSDSDRMFAEFGRNHTRRT